MMGPGPALRVVGTHDKSADPTRRGGYGRELLALVTIYWRHSLKFRPSTK
jgi:hypothetical protein